MIIITQEYYHIKISPALIDQSNRRFWKVLAKTVATSSPKLDEMMYRIAAAAAALSYRWPTKEVLPFGLSITAPIWRKIRTTTDPSQGSLEPGAKGQRTGMNEQLTTIGCRFAPLLISTWQQMGPRARPRPAGHGASFCISKNDMIVPLVHFQADQLRTVLCGNARDCSTAFQLLRSWEPGKGGADTTSILKTNNVSLKGERPSREEGLSLCVSLANIHNRQLHVRDGADGKRCDCPCLPPLKGHRSAPGRAGAWECKGIFGRGPPRAQ